ncbi:MAG: restriction endonuclease [Nannocystaceae bacterium]|nr:restriction endonuclease [Nannocystaceae bacterium]
MLSTVVQYAVIRTNKDKRSFILKELEAGRLRQGWGWLPEQDLRLLHAKKARGEKLTDKEKPAWRNRRMLADTWNGLQRGDIVVSPNLPEQGRWVLLVVDGAYEYDSGNGNDYRHVLPVRPLRTADGNIAIVDPGGLLVDARLRGTMRTMSRIWSIDHLGEAVATLVAAINGGVDVSVGLTAAERRDGFFGGVREAIEDLTWTRLRASYRGAEFEDLLVPVLESAYGKGTVKRHGGAGEHGADLIVTKEGALGLTFKTAIQVKMYDGILDDLHPVAQLREARAKHGVHAGVLLTTASEVSPRVIEALEELRRELQIDIQAWTRPDVVRLLLAHLGRREETP